MLLRYHGSSCISMSKQFCMGLFFGHLLLQVQTTKIASLIASSLLTCTGLLCIEHGERVASYWTSMRTGSHPPTACDDHTLSSCSLGISHDTV